MKYILTFYRGWLRLLFVLVPSWGVREAIRLMSTPNFRKVRNREMEILQKAEITSADGNLDGIRIYKWGTGRKKALLVHGWGGNAGSLGAFAAPLVEAGFSVYSFDGPAHGKNKAKTTNLFVFAGVIKQILATYHIRDLVIAHSFGSAATVAALGDSRWAVRQLVMITTPDKMEDVFREFGSLMRLKEAHLQGMFRYVQKKHGRSVQEMQVSRIAPGINVEKALLIHPVGDRVLPFAFSEQLAAKWPQASLLPLEKSGHYRVLWDQRVLQAVDQLIIGN